MADETTNTTTDGELGIIQVDSPLLKNIDYFMTGNENLTEVDCPFPYVTTAKYAFLGCTKLATFKGGSDASIENKGFPNLENASGMLYSTAIAQFSTDVVPMPSVTNASTMLWGCPNLSTVHLHMPSATNVDDIVLECTSLKYVDAYMDSLGTDGNRTLTLPEGVLTTNVSLPNAKYFYLPSTVTTASISVGAVKDCSALIPSNSALTSLTTSLPAATTFGGKSLPASLTHANLSFGALDNADNLLKGCINLSSSKFGIMGLSKLKSANYMFNGCTGMTSWQLEINSPSLISANGMFMGCTGLMSMKSYMSALVYAKDMFNGCTNLRYAYLHLASNKNGADVSSLQDGTRMFKGCSKLQLVAGLYKSIGEYDPINLSALTDGTEMFYGCNHTTFSEFYTDLPSLINGKEMFRNTHITTFGTTDKAIDMAKLINGTGMFRGNVGTQCNYLATFNAKATNLVDGSYMFAYNPLVGGYDQTANMVNFKLGNTTTTALDDNGHVYSHLNNGTSMFLGCEGLILINEEMINLSGLVNGNDMFHGCTSLKTVTTKFYSLLAAQNMFHGCNLDSNSLNYIESYINDLVVNRWVEYTEEDGEQKRNFLREEEWKYKKWSDTPITTVSEGDEGGQTNIVEETILPEIRGIIHVDYDDSVDDARKVSFTNNLKAKGWIVTSCEGANANLSISEDNMLDDGSASFVENIEQWKKQRYERYNMKITSITSRTNSAGKVEGVMHGTSDVSTDVETGNSGTES